MPILTANGTALMGVGCSSVAVDDVTPSPLVAVACKGFPRLLGPNTIIYQRCDDATGDVGCVLESLDLTTNDVVTIDEDGATELVGNGQGDWAAVLAKTTGAEYRDSLGRSILGAYPLSGDDITGKWIAVQNFASSLGLVALDRFGGVEEVTDGVVENAWIRNGVVSYARAGTLFFWPSGETSTVNVQGVRHSGTGWVVGHALSDTVVVVYRVGETTAIPISYDGRDYNPDVIEQTDGTLLVVTSTTQGESAGSLRRYVIDPDALTITRLHLPSTSGDYFQTVAEVSIAGSLPTSNPSAPTDPFIDPYARVTSTGGTNAALPSGAWTPPPGVNLSREYLTTVISETWFGFYGELIPANELLYWIDKCQNPDTFSDGYVRVGWNDYWKARMAPGNDGTADVSLAGTEGIIGTAESLGWSSGESAGSTPGDSDDYIPTNARAEALSVKASRGITPQLGLLEDDILYNLALLAANILEPLKNKYPSIVVVSGFRQVNTGISQHERGEAVDLQLANQTPELLYEVADYIAKSLQFDQLILNYSQAPVQSWIHVSFTADTLRREVSTRDLDDTFHAGLHLITELTGEARAAAEREQQAYAALIDVELKNLAARDKKLNPETVLGDVMLPSNKFNSEMSFDCGIPAPVRLAFDPYALVTRIYDRGINGRDWNLSNPNFEADNGCGRFVEAVVRALPQEWGHLVRTGYAPKAFEHAIDAVLYRSPVPLYNDAYYQIVYVVENAGRPDARPIWLPTCAPMGTSLSDAPQGGWSRDSTDEGTSPVTVSESQIVYPVEDLDNGSWTASSGTSFYALMDEPVFFDDTDYIQSASSDGVLVIELRQESIIVAQREIYRTTGAQTLEYVLTAAERARITNWSALEVWFTTNVDDVAKYALGDLETPGPGDVTLRVRVDMGL